MTNIVIMMGDYRQGYADTTTTTTTTMPHEGEEMMERRRYDRSPEGFTYEFRDVDLTNGEKGSGETQSAKRKSRFCPAWLRDGDGMPHFTSPPSTSHATPRASSKHPFPSSPYFTTTQYNSHSPGLSHPLGIDQGWKPFSMTTPILLSLALLSLLVAAGIETLAQRSAARGGLALAPTQDDIPAAAMFAYQYVPNVAAAVYSLVWNWVDLDVKRMQPWFELSKADGARGEDSLLLDYPVEFLAFVPLKAAKKRCVILGLFPPARDIEGARVLEWLGLVRGANIQSQALARVPLGNDHDARLLGHHAPAECHPWYWGCP